MATSDIDTKGKGLEISVELLRLFRGINKKLDSKTGLDRGEIAPSGDANPPPQIEEIFRWYENTPPSVQIADVRNKNLLRYSWVFKDEPFGLFVHNWTFQYKRPSKERTDMIRFAPNLASQMSGKPREIPQDGRIRIAELSGEYLFSSSLELNRFDELLRKGENAKLFLGDYDPWNDQFLVQPGFKKFVKNPRIQELEDSAIAGEEIFTPLTTAIEQTAQAPWRRVIFISGLGLMPAGSIPELTYNSTDVKILYLDSEIFSSLLKQHALCAKGSVDGSMNPYLSDCGFPLAFFEILEAYVEASQEQKLWETGSLFNEHSGIADTPNSETLRRSAFSIYISVARSEMWNPNQTALFPLYTAILLVPEWYFADSREFTWSYQEQSGKIQRLKQRYF